MSGIYQNKGFFFFCLLLTVSVFVYSFIRTDRIFTYSDCSTIDEKLQLERQKHLLENRINKCYVDSQKETKELIQHLRLRMPACQEKLNQTKLQLERLKSQKRDHSDEATNECQGQLDTCIINLKNLLNS